MAKQLRSRPIGPEAIEFYLPVALAQLQVNAANDLRHSYAGHSREEGGAAMAATLQRILVAAKARLADVYNERIVNKFYRPKWLPAYSELTDDDNKALAKEAEALKKWSINTNRNLYYRFAFDASSFKWNGDKDSKIGQAITAAARTIKECERRNLELRFVVDSGIISRKSHGRGFNDSYGQDCDFYDVHGYTCGISQRAWFSLVMFCGLAGGEMQKSALREAAKHFTGLGEKKEDFVKTGVMHFLEHDLRHPGMYATDQEDALREEIAAALK